MAINNLTQQRFLQPLRSNILATYELAVEALKNVAVQIASSDTISKKADGSQIVARYYGDESKSIVKSIFGIYSDGTKSITVYDADVEKIKEIEDAIAAAEKSAKAAATLINEKTSGFVTVKGVQDDKTGAWTYTVSENDIASAQDLAQEISDRQQSDEQLSKDIAAEISDRKAQDDVIEASIGLAADGSHVKTEGNYTSEAETIVDEIAALDAQVKENADAIDALEELMGEKSVSTQITEAIDLLDFEDNAVNNKYVASVSEEDGKISVARRDLVLSSDKVLSFNENGISSTIEIKQLTEEEVTALAEANVAEAYKLVGKEGTQLGQTIKIYKDQALKDVALDGQNLVFTYTLANGTDKVLTVDVSAFLTEEEYGNGLQVVDHVISAKLGEDTETNKNFLDLEGETEGEKALVVRSIDTDSTLTTDRVLVAGGPLDSTALRNILPKDESGNAYIEKGTDIQSLLLSLFTKVEWPSPKVTEGKIDTTIAQPSFTLTNSDKTVEVGTVCTLSEATLSTVSNATTARTCSEFTYGYASALDGAITKTKKISIDASNIGVNGDNYTMSRDFTGFANTDDSATPSTNAADVKLSSVECVVVEGDNKVKISVSGPKGTCQFAEMPQYYVVSNIGTQSAEHLSPSKELATINEDTTPTNNKELKVTGAYKYFLGYSEKTAFNQFDSASVRALTTKSGNITKDGTTTIIAENAPITSNGKSIVIACPSKYKLATISNGVGADILANFSSVGEVDVTTGSIVTKYKVYVYPITNGATVEFKKVTLTKA